MSGLVILGGVVGAVAATVAINGVRVWWHLRRQAARDREVAARIERMRVKAFLVDVADPVAGPTRAELDAGTEIAGVERMRSDRACTCTRGPDYDGPEPTCPVHGCPVCIITGGPHKTTHDSRRHEPDYVVIRVAPEMRTKVPPELDGRWFDRRDIPTSPVEWPRAEPTGIVAEPTGRFEVREDGAVAEVWEVRP